MQRKSISLSVLAATLVTAGIAVGSAHAVVYTMTATADGPNPESLPGQPQHNDWNNPSNWDTNLVPSGAVDVVVNPGLFAEVWSNSTPAYNGSLTLKTGASLQISWTRSATVPHQPNSLNAIGTGPITFESGSQLRLRLADPSTIVLPSLVMAGDASIHLSPSTSAHHTTRNIGSITGTGALQVIGNNNNTLNLNSTNLGWSGDFIADAEDGWRVEANVTGAFGMGDVYFNARAANDRGATLQIDAGDVISDMAILYLNGPRDQRRASKLILNAGEEIVAGFFVDGVDMGVGTFDASSGLTDVLGNPLITGNGSLTVRAAATNGVPEPASATLGLLALVGLARRRQRRIA